MSETTRIGIIGDGQLGRMLTEAAHDLGFEEVYALGEAGPNSPAANVGAIQIEGSIKDPDAIRSFVESVDVTTGEVEHINADTLTQLEAEGYNIQPSPKSLAIIKDKLLQKDHLQQHGIPVGPYWSLSNEADFAHAAQRFAGNLIVKARTGGFDGRGNYAVVEGAAWDDVLARFSDANGDHPQLYVEKKLAFDREVAFVGARTVGGHISAYPVVETIHTRHICDETIAPAPNMNHQQSLRAKDLGQEVMKCFKGAGIMAVEMFEINGEYYVNEVAPRVHNSGHWTDYGAQTSQFHQHIRAITDMPLGSTDMTAPTVVMKNILGTRTIDNVPDFGDIAVPPEVQLRGYHKTPRLDRKIGHITVPAQSVPTALRLAHEARQAVQEVL
ncbi:MAG: 5-(carboxyamino)imidazole ribonucleotide synthase [Candidatus Saccharimonadales bacterium]